ncbi:hypothetical protein F511_46115 [Dorcoceras hygrometricum]|uniref:Uncharacterized protein n=1 Tax=Dorcoceras hygrometricum TaxID=472368 RepID=A0A2Z7A1T5_9LAMI|nr:hypothetical protein F511_46115 [Dorcoceras hygrometricum]
MSNVEQEADNSKRNSEEGDVVLKNQQMMKKTARALSIDDVISSHITISRKLKSSFVEKRKDKDSADDI